MSRSKAGTSAAAPNAAREAALRAALDFPQALALVGTTSTVHLDEALGAARRVRALEASA